MFLYSNKVSFMISSKEYDSMHRFNISCSSEAKNINLLSTLSIRFTELACVKLCVDILLNTGVNSLNGLFKVFAPMLEL